MTEEIWQKKDMPSVRCRITENTIIRQPLTSGLEPGFRLAMRMTPLANGADKERRITKKEEEEMFVRKMQIGVMGSAADLGYTQEVQRLAEEVGTIAALCACTVVFGAEKDGDSLSTAAGRGARSAGGLTVGVTYGKGLKVFDEADVVITCGAERGGPRESVLVLSCDAIICISGGIGTLTEMLVAYQADIPIVALVGTGGWSDEMAGKFFDRRKRQLVRPAKTPKEAVEAAIRAIQEQGGH